MTLITLESERDDDIHSSVAACCCCCCCCCLSAFFIGLVLCQGQVWCREASNGEGHQQGFRRQVPEDHAGVSQGSRERNGDHEQAAQQAADLPAGRLRAAQGDDHGPGIVSDDYNDDDDDGRKRKLGRQPGDHSSANHVSLMMVML